MTTIPASFHHFGLAARDPGQALAYLKSIGYTCVREVWDPLQAVHLRWCEAKGAPAVEIVTPPLDRDGPLASVLASQGTSFYHLCHEIHVPMAEALGALERAGGRVLTVREPMPSVLFDGRLVSFHVVRGFGLVEFLHPRLGSASDGGGIDEQ